MFKVVVLSIQTRYFHTWPVGNVWRMQRNIVQVAKQQGHSWNRKVSSGTLVDHAGIHQHLITKISWISWFFQVDVFVSVFYVRDIWILSVWRPFLVIKGHHRHIFIIFSHGLTQPWMSRHRCRSENTLRCHTAWICAVFTLILKRSNK